MNLFINFGLIIKMKGVSSNIAEYRLLAVRAAIDDLEKRERKLLKEQRDFQKSHEIFVKELIRIEDDFDAVIVDEGYSEQSFSKGEPETLQAKTPVYQTWWYRMLECICFVPRSINWTILDESEIRRRAIADLVAGLDFGDLSERFFGQNPVDRVSYCQEYFPIGQQVEDIQKQRKKYFRLFKRTKIRPKYLIRNLRSAIRLTHHFHLRTIEEFIKP